MSEFWDRPVRLSTQEPLDLEMTKAALRFVSDEEDELIEGWIATARAYFEEQTGRQLIDATWEYARAGAPFARAMELPRPPLVGDVVITYDDANGQEQTFDADRYTVTPSFVSPGGSPTGTPVIDPHCARGLITLVDGASWPAARDAAWSFRVRRTCGYGTTPAKVPRIIQTTLYLLVALYHANRVEAENVSRGGGFQRLPLGADDLIKTFKYSARPRLPIATGTMTFGLVG